MTLDLIEWTKQENRLYQRLALQSRLIFTFIDDGKFTEALKMVAEITPDLKRMDDKVMLLEIYLAESRAYYGLKHFPKSRASLTTARTFANKIYVTPLVQASLDAQAGMLHAEEGDFKTAYAYFYETFEGLSALNSPRSVQALKYLLLCKIMTDQPDEVSNALHTKLIGRHPGDRHLDAMVAIAKAYSSRSLRDFERLVKVDYSKELTDDVMIKNHLGELYDMLMDKNLLKVIEPFSIVQLDHVSKLMGLERSLIEAKLCKMILDKTLNGTIDDQTGTLSVVYQRADPHSYHNIVSLVHQTEGILSLLAEKAMKLKA